MSQVFNLFSHVVKGMLILISGIGAKGSTKLLSKRRGKTLCQHVQITASHGLIVGLSRGRICVCAMHGGSLRLYSFWGHSFLFKSPHRRRQTVSDMKLENVKGT